MKEIFGKRLKYARIQAGLSQDQLVAKMNNAVTKNAISKYEKGEMMCNSEVLTILSDVLKVRPDYFLRPFGAELPVLEFRKKSSLLKKDLEAIKISVASQLELYLEIEQYLNIDASCSNPLSHLTIRNGNDVEVAAGQLLDLWQLGHNSLPNVLKTLEEKGVKVIESEAHEKFDGFSGWIGGKIPMIVINRNFTLDRKRLTALHELGHLFLRFAPGLSQKEIERMCFRFAAAMLMPKETFFRELGVKRTTISFNELVYLKELFGLSVQAIMARAKDLEVITDFYFLTFRKKINTNRKEEGLGEYTGAEATTRFRQLVYRAVSEDIISMSKAADLCGIKLAEFRNEYRSA